MEQYVSVKNAINRKAAKHSVRHIDISTFENQVLDKARKENPGKSGIWYLSLVEYCVWEHFFPGQPFPGEIDITLTIHPTVKMVLAKNRREPGEIVVKAEDQKNIEVAHLRGSYPKKEVEEESETIRVRGDYFMPAYKDDLAKRDWVHDRYQSGGASRGGLSERSGNVSSLPSRDNWPPRPPVSREGDFYRPGASRREVSRVEDVPKLKVSIPELKTSSETYGRLSPPQLDTPPTGPKQFIGSAPIYESQTAEIWRRQPSLSVLARDLTTAFNEYRDRIDAQYPQESRSWKTWAMERSVWARFIPNERFPGVEPVRRASAPLNLVARTDDAHKLARRAVSTTVVRHPENDKTRPRAERVPNPAPLYYHMQEKEMEELAIKRNIKHDFFSFLQKARDRARMDHPDCASEIRHYLADKETWERFFKNIPFKGTKPKSGHAGRCRDRLMGDSPPKEPSNSSQIRVALRPAPVLASARNPTIAGPSRSSQPLLAPKGVTVPVRGGENGHALAVQAKGFIETQPSMTMLAALGIARHGPNQGKDGIVMVGCISVFGGTGKPVELLTHALADNSRSVTICTALQCTFRYHRTNSGHLLLWASSDVNDMTAVERGHTFLHAWATRALGSVMIRPFSFFAEKCRAVFEPKPDPKPQDLQTAATCWDEYKNLTGASPVDCLVVEEAAKGEGELRMVLDKVAGEVISVKNLLKRDRYRSSGDGPPRSASDSSSAAAVPSGAALGVAKRKMDGGDGFLPDADSDTKRLCVEG